MSQEGEERRPPQTKKNLRGQGSRRVLGGGGSGEILCVYAPSWSLNTSPTCKLESHRPPICRVVPSEIRASERQGLSNHTTKQGTLQEIALEAKQFKIEPVAMVIECEGCGQSSEPVQMIGHAHLPRHSLITLFSIC